MYKGRPLFGACFRIGCDRSCVGRNPPLTRICSAAADLRSVAFYTTNCAPLDGTFRLSERNIYGSSRLGRYIGAVELYPTPQVLPTQEFQDQKLQYELTDHLGNVTSVVTGRLLPGQGAPHEAQVLSAQGYEPFGSLLPGRHYSSDSYRFGFNGMPSVEEINGERNSYDFWVRLCDLRGRGFRSRPIST